MFFSGKRDNGQFLNRLINNKSIHSLHFSLPATKIPQSQLLKNVCVSIYVTGSCLKNTYTSNFGSLKHIINTLKNIFVYKTPWQMPLQLIIVLICPHLAAPDFHRLCFFCVCFNGYAPVGSLTRQSSLGHYEKAT